MSRFQNNNLVMGTKPSNSSSSQLEPATQRQLASSYVPHSPCVAYNWKDGQSVKYNWKNQQPNSALGQPATAAHSDHNQPKLATTTYSHTFIPAYTENNPYVRPYLETIKAPLSGSLLLNMSVSRHEKEARYPTPTSDSHDYKNDNNSPIYYTKETQNLYTSRLLSPTMEMYVEVRRKIDGL